MIIIYAVTVDDLFSRDDEPLLDYEKSTEEYLKLLTLKIREYYQLDPSFEVTRTFGEDYLYVEDSNGKDVTLEEQEYIKRIAGYTFSCFSWVVYKSGYSYQ